MTHSLSSIPAHRRRSAGVVFVAVLVLTAAGDLVSKSLAFRYVAGEPVVLTRANAVDHRVIPGHEPVPIVPGVLSLQLTTNSGAVFGLGKGGQYVFIVVSLIAIAVIVRVFLRSRADATLFHVCLALVLGGAVGNLYDRIRFNAVRDLLLLLPDTKLWPWLFNVADAALMVGVGVIIVITWKSDMRPQSDQTESD